MSNPPIPLLGRIAVHLKLITVQQLAEATRRQGQAGTEKRLGEILVETGMLTQAQLEKVLTVRQQMLAKQRAKAAVEKALPEPEPGAARASAAPIAPSPSREKSADRPHSKRGEAARAARRSRAEPPARGTRREAPWPARFRPLWNPTHPTSSTRCPTT
jgi:hypothetical protein